jgi:hypothetical protein
MNKSHPKSSKAENLPARPVLKLMDEAADCCVTIETLAGWLKCARESPETDSPDAALVANTGYLIDEQLQRLRALHERLGQQLSGK